MLRLTVSPEEYLMINDNIKTDPEERAKLPKYYAEEEHPEKYRKKSNVIITKGNADK